MPLIEGTCKNCGGIIEFDDSLTNGVCKFCGTPFLKEDIVINNHYHNKFENATVIYNDENSLENKIKSAEFYLNKLNDYEEAEDIFIYVTKNKPSDYRAWWGLVKVYSKNFSYVNCSEEEYENIKSYADRALSVADDEQKNVIYQDWKNYSEIVIQSFKISTRNNKLRKSIAIILTLGINAAIVVWELLSNAHDRIFNELEPLYPILIALGISVVVTSIIGIIGRTKVCAFFSGAAAVATTIILGHGLLFGGENSTSALIFGLVIILVSGALLTAICFILPKAIISFCYK